jgi:formylglycine-generating enzyme required for sulfatase activity
MTPILPICWRLCPGTRQYAFWAGFVLLAGCRPATEPRQDRPPERISVSGVSMIALSGGEFEMGGSDPEESDQPPHRIYVSPFLIDKYPVTQQAYEKLMRRNPSHWKAPQHPVDHIRWRDAAEYCNARSRSERLTPAYDPQTWECSFAVDGYRLPTEAEYEYALRAGTATAYFFGNSAADLGRYAWFKANSPRGSHPVGQQLPNRWGLHDMVGNIWEWCQDWYQEDYYQQSPPRDPQGPASGENRVVRGGSWNSKPADCRSAYRNYELPAFTDICFAKDIHGQIGFRCVKRLNSERTKP